MTTVKQKTEPTDDVDPSAHEKGLIRALAWPVALLFILAAILLLAVLDLVHEAVLGLSTLDIDLELGAIALAFVGAFGTTVQIVSGYRRERRLSLDLRGTREEAERCRSEKTVLLRRFGKAAEHHFHGWGLTSAEREIALLVLRGLSYKEIACARGTAERTVRHQAIGIYRKAGVASRAEMAAVFLRDVLGANEAAPEALLPKAETTGASTLVG